MHLRRRRQVTTAGLAVCALALAACSSSSSSSTSSLDDKQQRIRVEQQRPAQRHAQRERVELPDRLPAVGHPGLQVGPARHDGQLRQRRLGQGAHATWPAGITNFAGSDSPIPAAEASTFKGKTVLYFPVVIGPITVSYNLSGLSKPLAAVGAGHRGHLRGQGHDVEQLGDRGG